MKYSFTVFTPTYNREKSILDVYNSLERQTYKNFQWIVIDDGSADGTGDLIKSVIEKATFPIIYKYQDNSGKHIAQNRALDLAEGELFLPLDSDDTIVPEALEIIWNAWVSIPEEQRSEFSGIGVHCINQYGDRIGPAWPEDGMISNDLEIRFKYKITSEKWGPIRTDIMREYKNPEIKGHYFSESTVWYKIAQRYKKKYINANVRIYIQKNDSVSVKNKENTDYNFDCYIEGAKIYINDFYCWYAKYDKKGLIKKVLILSKKCADNKKPLLLGKDAMIKSISPIPAKIIMICASAYKPFAYLKSKLR